MRIASALLLLSIVALSVVGAAAAMWSEELKIDVTVSTGWSDPEMAKACAVYCFINITNTTCYCHHHVYASCYCGTTCCTMHRCHKCHSLCREHPTLTLTTYGHSAVMEIEPRNYTELRSALIIKVVNRGTIPVTIAGVNTYYTPASITLKRKVFIVPMQGIRTYLDLLTKIGRAVKPCGEPPRLPSFKPYTLDPGEEIYIVVLYSISGMRSIKVTITTGLEYQSFNR